jgi:hypothetical protein
VTDPISRLNPALELLRQRLAEHAQRLDTPGKGGAARAGGALSAREPASAESLRRRVAERLKAIDAADPQRERKSRRAFIESVLSLEFGEALHNDPKTLELIERIERAIDRRPELDRQFRAVLARYSFTS